MSVGDVLFGGTEDVEVRSIKNLIKDTFNTVVSKIGEEITNALQTNEKILYDIESGVILYE